EPKNSIVTLKFDHPVSQDKTLISLKDTDRADYLKKLKFSTDAFKKINKKEKKVVKMEMRKPNFYAKLSNRLFLNLSTKFVNKGSFNGLAKSIKKADLPFLTNTYVSMIFFSTVLGFLAGVFASLILFLFDFGFYSFSLVLIGPVAAYFAVYTYPQLEAKSISVKIKQELPFVTIYMAAVVGSGVEPSRVFSIVASGDEYPYTKREMKKLINQINIYGLDLVSSLKNSALATPNKDLGELFNGLATTISSGGSLKDFLEKRSEGLLIDYKLEREKYTKMAETFMNIYISVLIAAPMMLMMLFVLMSMTGLSIGLSTDMISLLILLVISALNVVFLIALHLKQPEF
ncbi:hypothetical protein COV15_01990, partial [Candidatus Woesearchaeota archaeon CG10_big_fil_rev_8_21_14_0_10_34_12]